MIRYDSPDFSGVTVHASMVMNSPFTMVNTLTLDPVKPEMVEGLEIGYAFGETEATAGTQLMTVR